MADLTPVAFLNVGYDRQAFGWMKYCGDTLSWPLAQYLGVPDASFDGLTVDPSGEYIMLTAIPIPMHADPTQWTGSTSVDRYGTDEASLVGGDVVLGKKFFIHGDPSKPLDVTLKVPRLQNEGFSLRAFLAAAQAPSVTSSGPGTPISTYIVLSDGHDSGTNGLRLAFEPGKLIRLQQSATDDNGDEGPWTETGLAFSSLGECESYLDSVGRYVEIDVLPETDPTWEAGLPNSALTSGPPPNRVIITIGKGDAKITFLTDALSAGALRVQATGRQVSLRPCKKRFLTGGNAILPPIGGRATPFATQVQPYGIGYLPYADYGQIDVILTDVNAAYAILTIAVPDEGIDDTGYAVFTPFLSHVEAYFPPKWDPPLPYPDYTTYNAIGVDETLTYNQVTGLVRASARIAFEDENYEYAPGNVLQAVRAATLWRGWIDELGNIAVYPGLTGWTALAPENGMEWEWRDGQKHFGISLHDRLRRGDADQVICGYLPAFDNQCHYYAIRQLMYKIGVTDEWMIGWPYCGRDSDCNHYHLPYGTTRNPLLQFHQEMPVGSAMQTIRRISAEFDASGQPQPMVLGFGAGGISIYEPLPIGVVQAFLDPSLQFYQTGLDVKQTFSRVPLLNFDGTPQLNEFLDTLRTNSDLSRIRTPVVVEGIDPRTGSAVVAAAFNETNGGGPYSDPNSVGYVGLDVPFYDINRLFSNEPTARLAAQLARVQLAFPGVSTQIQAFLQPNLYPLDIIAAIDPYTQGTDAAVGYYPETIHNRVDMTTVKYDARTNVFARLLGQAGN